jgi:hypothetical protein
MATPIQQSNLKRGSVHTDDPHVPIAVTGNHNLVRRRHAVDAHSIAVWPVAQGPADGVGPARALQEADVPVLCPRQYLSRALPQALRHSMLDEADHKISSQDVHVGCTCGTCLYQRGALR